MTVREFRCTSTHCPYFEACAECYMSLRRWINIALRNWKKRRTCNIDYPYHFKLHRNIVDVRFCPVHWLSFWLTHLESVGVTKGPIFPADVPEKSVEAWNESAYKTMMTTLLIKVRPMLLPHPPS